MKTTLAVLLGLVVGVVVGAGGIHQWLMPQLMETESALLDARHEIDGLKTESAESRDKLARLEEERAGFTEKLDAAYARLGSVRTAPEPAPVEPVADLEVAEAPPEAAPEEAPQDGSRRRDSRRGGADSRWGGTPEEREARRQEFVTRMQDNMSNFFTGELEKSSTPAMQDRIVAIEDKVYGMFDLRNQMRSAETDEDREALGQEFGDAMSEIRQLMNDQQRDMIGAIANQFGISRESDQAAFEQAVRAAVDSPFFSDNPGALLWNAGRSEDGGQRFGGGGPGGFGGGFGGSGGGPGGFGGRGR